MAMLMLALYLSVSGREQQGEQVATFRVNVLWTRDGFRHFPAKAIAESFAQTHHIHFQRLLRNPKVRRHLRVSVGRLLSVQQRTELEEQGSLAAVAIFLLQPLNHTLLNAAGPQPVCLPPWKWNLGGFHLPAAGGIRFEAQRSDHFVRHLPRPPAAPPLVPNVILETREQEGPKSPPLPAGCRRHVALDKMTEKALRQIRGVVRRFQPIARELQQRRVVVFAELRQRRIMARSPLLRCTQHGGPACRSAASSGDFSQ